VSEETEGQDTGAEAVAGGVDPAAMALALGGASREQADAFLKDQRRLIAEQMHHLHGQYVHLRLGIWEKRLGVLLRIATAFTGLAIAAGLAFMIWDASQSSGLLIEPFSIPPDVAQRGMTGQVVAAKLLDQLALMQAQTVSARSPKSYSNNWSESGIKLDIPETGVSLTELDDFLRKKLGHDTHITGELVRTTSGLSLTARTGMEGAESVTGSEADLDILVQKLGASVYEATQPFRYATYLIEHGRPADAIPTLKALTRSSSPVDRAYGYAVLGRQIGERYGIDASIRVFEHGIATEPDNSLAFFYLGELERNRSLPEQSIRDFQQAGALIRKDPLALFDAGSISRLELSYQALLDTQFGNFNAAEREEAEYTQSIGSNVPTIAALLTQLLAREHNLAAARAMLADAANYSVDLQAGHTALERIEARMQIDAEAQDWTGVLSEIGAIAPLLQQYPGMRSFLPTMIVPLSTYAEAGLGKSIDAEAHIATTPPDCYDCLITRARIAELRGQRLRADWWFARAIAAAPSIPFAYSYWGQALLTRGDADGAIVKFTLANQNGPKFADPLEMWGEALMAKNQSHLALAKFAEADKYAPNWGRLHLKWGEALGYAGRKDEARAQFQKASTLDLTAADKAELAKVSAHG